MKILQMPIRNVANAEVSHTDGQGGVLSQVWATEGNLAHAVLLIHAEADSASAGPQPVLSPVLTPAVKPAGASAERERAATVFRTVLAPGTAFYRTYTEAMLRRYGVLSLESGRVPSLLGREMFRGKVTSYRVHAFDDVVIFVHDVERCIQQLAPEQQRLILRIAVQEYTLEETAAMLRLSLRSTRRRYMQALDELTGAFLDRRLMERIDGNRCQEGAGSVKLVSYTP
ncbi:sigma factor-like helix-turn-helix DNA-binding protein [Terriglobus roseus]|uniref:Sigma-70, region 4 n=1 Tax=Terriglobus roseus TaxID=392734 RepID=A0A1H4MYJ9_9BACT|nr:sigma factor-like helix-turn-helix DNA-binding protein [Terriglobus roseus]SEB87854.1 Sigma-70, region 4 [Terriglobus roseus]